MFYDQHRQVVYFLKEGREEHVDWWCSDNITVILITLVTHYFCRFPAASDPKSVM